MNRKLIISVVVAVVIILAIILIFWLLPKKTPANLNQNRNVNKANVNLVNTQVNKNVNKQVVKDEEKVKSDLSRVASSFAERFGSYSNQSDFENITNLQLYMTDSMKKWSDQFVQTYRQNNKDTSIYYGITTKTISTKMNNFSDREAVFNITTQRKEATGTTDNARIYYQDITVKFVKEQGVWKVNEAKWQEQTKG